jgi:hypothetical protein
MSARLQTFLMNDRTGVVVSCSASILLLTALKRKDGFEAKGM